MWNSQVQKTLTTQYLHQSCQCEQDPGIVPLGGLGYATFPRSRLMILSSWAQATQIVRNLQSFNFKFILNF